MTSDEAMKLAMDWVLEAAGRLENRQEEEEVNYGERVRHVSGTGANSFEDGTGRQKRGSEVRYQKWTGRIDPLLY